MTLRQLAAEPPTLPSRTTWYLTDLAEARGKQELFTRQSPQKLKALLAAIARQIGTYRVTGLQAECPGVGLGLIRQLLARLQKEKQVKALGTGRGAKWQKLEN